MVLGVQHAKPVLEISKPTLDMRIQVYCRKCNLKHSCRVVCGDGEELGSRDGQRAHLLGPGGQAVGRGGGPGAQTELLSVGVWVSFPLVFKFLSLTLNLPQGIDFSPKGC